MDYTVVERDDLPTGHDFVVIRTSTEVIVVLRRGVARTIDATATIWAAARQAEASASAPPRLRVSA